MSNDHIDVRYVAKLARLDLTPDEVTLFQSQLDSILSHVDSLTALELPADLVPEGAQNLGPMRDDSPHESLLHTTILSNAPDQAQAQIRVPKVVADA